MPHSFTTDERELIAGPHDEYGYLEITDPDGNWVDVSADFGEIDFLNAMSISDDIDSNTMSFSASLLREDIPSGLSLAPLLESSSLNRDMSDSYAPMLDLVRMWRIYSAITEKGVAPTTEDKREIGKGYIDKIGVSGKNESVVTLIGRGEEAALLDFEIVDPVYCAQDTPISDYIQALIDAGETPFTLFVPETITQLMNEISPGLTGNQYNAIQSVADIVGGRVRCIYDTDGVNKLTFYIPNREAEEGEEDYSFGPEEYLDLPLNDLDITNVRNDIRLKFYNADTGVQDQVRYPISGASGSITTYKRRIFPITLAADTQIVSAESAQAFVDAVGKDLELPKLMQQATPPGFWPVQICDWVKMLPNGVHY